MKKTSKQQNKNQANKNQIPLKTLKSDSSQEMIIFIFVYFIETIISFQNYGSLENKNRKNSILMYFPSNCLPIVLCLFFCKTG